MDALEELRNAFENQRVVLEREGSTAAASALYWAICQIDGLGTAGRVAVVDLPRVDRDRLPRPQQTDDRPSLWETFKMGLGL